MKQTTAPRRNARSQNKREISAQYKMILLHLTSPLLSFICGFFQLVKKAGVSKLRLQEGQGVFKPAW